MSPFSSPLNSTVSHNSANQYGGILYGDNSRVVNSTISYNAAAAGIGGMGKPDHGAIYGPFQPAYVVNSTIVYNDAGSGTAGGIYAGDWGTSLVNSIVAENTSGGGTTPDDVVGPFGGGHNLIGSVNNSTGLDVMSSFWGTNNNYLHPGLIELAAVGGPANAFALPPDSAAIDAGDDGVAAAYDLIFDQMGEGSQRVVGDHVDIGASEAHVILRIGVMQVYGTDLDDNIDVMQNAVTIDRIGTIAFDGASLIQMDIDTGDGGDSVVVADGVSYAVRDADDPADNPVDSGPVIDFDPGRISLANFPSNPDLTLVSANDDWLGYSFGVAWRAPLFNFLEDPDALGSRWLNTKIAIVQIVKSTIDVEGWFSAEAYIESVYNYDWRIDSIDEGIIIPLPADMVYPFRNATFGGSTIINFAQTPNGILSAEDSPGFEGYGISSLGAYRTHYLRQEFETYVIGLEGNNGVKIDSFSQVYGSDSIVWRKVKNVTVYGGVKWYQDFVFHESSGATTYYYDQDAAITDTTGEPTDNFRKALRDFLNFSQNAD